MSNTIVHNCEVEGKQYDVYVKNISIHLNLIPSNKAQSTKLLSEVT